MLFALCKCRAKISCPPGHGIILKCGESNPWWRREAEAIVESVERGVTADPSTLPPLTGKKQRIRRREYTPWSEIWHAVAHVYPTRSILGFTLMVTQAFLYNAIFFTYTLALVQFYKVPPETVSVYLFPFAFGNLLGPILLGHPFDSIGRKTMITLTYVVSGVLLALTGYLFQIGVLNAVTQTIAWSIIFFIASAASSAGYLILSSRSPLFRRYSILQRQTTPRWSTADGSRRLDVPPVVAIARH